MGSPRRSGLEHRFEEYLKRDGVSYKYEPFSLKYEVPVTKRRYKPDFVVDDKKIIFETKGRFKAEDRKKMILVKEQYPDYRIVMVFGRAKNTIAKKSKTTYGEWCTANGIEWYDIEDMEKGNICRLFSTKKRVVGASKTPQKKKSKTSKPSRSSTSGTRLGKTLRTNS